MTIGTLATLCYWNPALFSGLSALLTGIGSRLGKSGQSTTLSRIGQQTAPVTNLSNSNSVSVSSVEVKYPEPLEKFLNWRKNSFFEELRRNEENEYNEHDKYKGLPLLFKDNEDNDVAYDLTSKKGELEKAIPADGQVASYTFDGNARDTSGHGHDLKIVGLPDLVEGRSGYPNSAYCFGGVSCKNYFMYAPPIKLGTNQMTISSHFYPMVHFGGDFSLCRVDGYFIKLYRGVDLRLLRRTKMRGFRVGTYSFNRSSIIIGLNSPLMKLEDWYHVAVTYDGQKQRMYINSFLVDERDKFLSFNDSLPMFMGDGKFFSVIVDDLTIYNRVLSKSEIEALSELRRITYGNNWILRFSVIAGNIFGMFFLRSGDRFLMALVMRVQRYIRYIANAVMMCLSEEYRLSDNVRQIAEGLESDGRVTIPLWAQCGISYSIMINPVFTAPSGHSFDEASLKSFFQMNPNFLHPITRQRFSAKDVHPNYNLREVIRYFLLNEQEKRKSKLVTDSLTDEAGIDKESLEVSINPEDVPGFKCRLGNTFMEDPVVTPSGYSYERGIILERIRAGNSTDPETGKPLSEDKLTPNLNLRDAIKAYIEARKKKGAGNTGFSDQPSSFFRAGEQNVVDSSVTAVPGCSSERRHSQL